jgi:hypothetical protein
MHHLSRQLSLIALFMLRFILRAIRPWTFVLFGLTGVALCLIVGEMASAAVVAALPFAFVALLGLWWGWQSRRNAPPLPATLSARIVEAEDDDHREGPAP